MPTFPVLCRVDAYVDYLAEVEADSAEDAALIARGSPSDFKWTRQGEAEFDAALYVTLDDKGSEIDGTQCGDLA